MNPLIDYELYSISIYKAITATVRKILMLRKNRLKAYVNSFLLVK